MVRVAVVVVVLCLLQITLWGQVSSHTVQVDGLTRTYELFIPAGYNATQPTSLVFNLHGYTSNAVQQYVYSDMNSVADTAGFIAVYPNGINNAWNSFSNFSASSADDVRFISYLIVLIASQYNIDPARVYACGMSNGGFMSYRLACELDGRIAAIASVTGLTDAGIMATCTNTRPLPVMQIHGTADATVPYNGGTGLGSVDSTVNFWKAKLNCPANAVIDTLPDVNLQDGSRAVRFFYEPCDSSTQLILYKIINGAHTWPDATLTIGVTNRDFNASATIWNFFKQFSHPSPSGIDSVVLGAPALPFGEAPLQVYPNPMYDVLVLNVPGLKQITMLNAQGQVVVQQQWPRPLLTGVELSVSTLPTGLYLLQMETETGKAVARVIK